jgi:hypothetical protein
MTRKPDETEEAKLPNGQVCTLNTWIEWEEESYQNVYGEPQPKNTDCVYIKVEASLTAKEFDFVGRDCLGMVCYDHTPDGKAWLKENIAEVKRGALADLTAELKREASGSAVQTAELRCQTAKQLLEES